MAVTRRAIVFYGDVGAAEVDGGVARVVAAGMEQLRESILPAFSGANLHPTEIVYTVMRLAGLKNHQMKIEDVVPGRLLKYSKS